MNFTKRKFLNLKSVTQHIQCSKMVRSLYIELIQTNQVNTQLLHSYQEIEHWLNLPSVLMSFEELSKRYHYHLSVAQKEPDAKHLLPFSKHLDRPSAKPFLPIDIYLDQLRSLHNIGSIIRTIEAFRLGTLCSTLNKTDFKHPKLKKTSMGCESLIPTKTLKDFDELKRPIIGLEITDSSQDIFTFNFPKSFSLLVGNEECGLSQENIERCDHILHIPLLGQKNSLNVANAFAIVASIISKNLSSKD